MEVVFSIWAVVVVLGVFYSTTRVIRECREKSRAAKVLATNELLALTEGLRDGKVVIIKRATVSTSSTQRRNHARAVVTPFRSPPR